MNAILLYLVSFVIFSAPRSVSGKLRGVRRELYAQNSVLCKMYTEGTTYENQDKTEEEVCAPIVDGVETETLIPLKLPDEIRQEHGQDIKAGQLIVLLSHAEVVKNGYRRDIAVHPANEFFVIQDDPRLRHLQQRQLETTGSLTVAIVRVSTKDSSPTATKQQMENTFNEEMVNIKTQYDLCSNGKLNLRKASQFVVEVDVNAKISEFTTPAELITEASGVLGGAHNLADKVLFCIPPGTGNWAASASMNFWRAQFNDGFCTSLSAMSHEFAHLIGIPHSNEGGARYGDSVGYMSRSYRNANWPRRCFNGANSGALGWYSDKTLLVNQGDNAELVKLAGVVDYEKAANDEPVLVDIGNNQWIQYNRAKWYTSDTGEYPDTVVITEMQDGGTEVLGTVRPGETYRSGNFAVKACKRVSGGEGKADHMLISVGKGNPVCPAPGNSNNNTGGGNNNNNSGGNNSNNNSNTATERSQESETPFPTAAPGPGSRPTPTPPTPATSKPTGAPTSSPTSSPTESPTEVPTTSPTDNGDGDEDEDNDSRTLRPSDSAPIIDARTGADNWWENLVSLPENWFSF